MSGDPVPGIEGTVDETGTVCEIRVEAFAEDQVGQWHCEVNQAPFR